MKGAGAIQMIEVVRSGANCADFRRWGAGAIPAGGLRDADARAQGIP
jgi:hypothetical protein